jgi:hypothetical protein
MRKHDAVRRWVVISVAAAAAITIVDALLLQRRVGLFTGGFLAVDTLRGPAARAGFAAASLWSDLAVTAPLAAVALWACARRRLSRGPASLLAVTAALLPLLVADVVNYSLASYIGDALNLAMLFELSGRSPMELFAVGAVAITILLAAIAAVAALVGGAAWLAQRRSRRAPARETPPLPRKALFAAAAIVLLGSVLSVAIRAAAAPVDNGLRRKPSGQAIGWVAMRLTDVDGDGYGWLTRPADPAPTDAGIFPYAIDRPGNGVDENGMGGDLPAGAAYVEPAVSPPRAAGPRAVVRFALEGFRADLLGARYARKEITPVLNMLHGRGAAVPLAYSHNGYTAQSRRHLLGGTLAGLRRDSLIDDFRAAGYEVAYFSGQDESFGGPALDAGFDRADVAFDARQARDRRYTTFQTPGSLAVPLGVVQERIGRFLASRSRTRPLFLYVSFHDTHFPYSHRAIQPLLSNVSLSQSAIVPGRAAALQAMYANTASNVDRAIGTVLSAVGRATGAAPAVIVTSDHGESLFDDGLLGHGTALTDVQTRVPLVIANLPVTIEQPIGQSELRGVLLRAMSGGTPARPRPVVRTVAEKAVFQYLGTFERPAQIALTRASGRTIVDIRTNRVRVPGSDAWLAPEALTAPDRERWLEVVRAWERMRLAVARAR